MHLKLTLTDQRVKGNRVAAAVYGGQPDFEDYTRVELDATGSASVVANTLRALADDLEPPLRRITGGDRP